MKKDNIIQQKSFAFAIRIVNLYKYLTTEKKNLFFQNNFWGVEHPLEPTLKNLLEDNQKKIFFQNLALHTKK